MKMPGKIPKWLLAMVYKNRIGTPLTRPLMVLSLYLDYRPTYRREVRRLRHAISREGLPLIANIHIPKTAGRYVNFLKETVPHINLGHVVVRRDRSDKYVPVGLTGIDEKKVEGFYLFSTIRNPLTWLVSYYYQSGGGEGTYNNPKFHDYPLALKGFDFFINTILDREDKWPNRKFLFPSLFSQSGHFIIDWVNQIETLDHNLDALARRFGRTFTPRKKKNVSNKVCSIEHHYTPALLRRAEKTYSREMRIFGYRGFETTGPEIGLRPAEKHRLEYDYLSDELKRDGRVVKRDT